jgi:hypothetical protein
MLILSKEVLDKKMEAFVISILRMLQNNGLAGIDSLKL